MEDKKIKASNNNSEEQLIEEKHNHIEIKFPESMLPQKNSIRILVILKKYQIVIFFAQKTRINHLLRRMY